MCRLSIKTKILSSTSCCKSRSLTRDHSVPRVPGDNWPIWILSDTSAATLMPDPEWRTEYKLRRPTTLINKFTKSQPRQKASQITDHFSARISPHVLVPGSASLHSLRGVLFTPVMRMMLLIINYTNNTIIAAPQPILGYLLIMKLRSRLGLSSLRIFASIWFITNIDHGSFICNLILSLFYFCLAACHWPWVVLFLLSLKVLVKLWASLITCSSKYRSLFAQFSRKHLKCFVLEGVRAF